MNETPAEIVKAPLPRGVTTVRKPVLPIIWADGFAGFLPVMLAVVMAIAFVAGGTALLAAESQVGTSPSKCVCRTAGSPLPKRSQQSSPPAFTLPKIGTVAAFLSGVGALGSVVVAFFMWRLARNADIRADKADIRADTAEQRAGAAEARAQNGELRAQNAELRLEIGERRVAASDARAVLDWIIKGFDNIRAVNSSKFVLLEGVKTYNFLGYLANSWNENSVPRETIRDNFCEFITRTYEEFLKITDTAPGTLNSFGKQIAEDKLITSLYNGIKTMKGKTS